MIISTPVSANQFNSVLMCKLFLQQPTFTVGTWTIFVFNMINIIDNACYCLMSSGEHWTLIINIKTLNKIILKIHVI